jgi:hypothetical protein
VVSYEEMLELAAQGAKVLQVRSVEFGRNHGVRIHVRSSFSYTTGTWVGPEEDKVEDAIISGVAHDTSEAKLTIQGLPDRPGVARGVHGAGRRQRQRRHDRPERLGGRSHRHLVHAAARGTPPRPRRSSSRCSTTWTVPGCQVDPDVAKVSLVGAGMKTNPGIAAKMFAALSAADVNIEMISTSTIRVSVVVSRDDVETAVQAVHAVFGLGDDADEEGITDGCQDRDRRCHRCRRPGDAPPARAPRLPPRRGAGLPRLGTLGGRKRLPWRDGEVEVRAVSAEAFDGVDIALFSAGGGRSREWAPVAAERGAVVVDNSSAFRMDDDVPLVVSEVNPAAITRRPKGIVANPNCTTMVLMVAAKPLHDAFGLTEAVATSYQAAGGPVRPGSPS